MDAPGNGAGGGGDGGGGASVAAGVILGVQLAINKRQYRENVINLGMILDLVGMNV